MNVRIISHTYAALVLALFAPPLFAADATKPNIVLIVADDLGINDLGCYGRRDQSTPHLDRLAAEGLRFTCAYCAQPICSPSRAAMMTGKHPARLHLTTFLPGRADSPSQQLLHPKITQQLPLAEETSAEFLKAGGYKTGYFGKWHLGGNGFGPKEQGFDEYFPGRANTTPSATEGGKGEYELTDAACKFIREQRDAPFFVYLAHNNPHISLAAKPELIAKNKDAYHPLYAAVVETLDDSVGRLLRTLDEEKLTERTLVIFTSDNGGLHVMEGKDLPATHNTPFRAGKGYLYEGGLRVPLIARLPGRLKPGVVDVPQSTLDLPPTLLGFAGLPVPRDLDGRDQSAEWSGGAASPRPFFWHFPHYTNQGSRPAGAVRDGGWKLIEFYEDGAVELYNLAADPSEEHNLAAKEPRRVDELREKLRDWRKQVGAQENRPNPDFDADLHRRLYVDFDASRLKPSRTAAETAEGQRAWRKALDGAAGKKK